LKYSPTNASIEINIRHKNNIAVVSIQDSGPGIPDTDKEKVFTKFYRIGNEETRSAKGTGLGLFITKNLCDLHNIHIHIGDHQPTGAVFTLTFS
jgi:signal transduction histidine kinase